MKRVLLLTLGLVTTSVWAECSREDVDHYLDKGFTPDQVTALCTTAPKTQAKEPAESGAESPRAAIVRDESADQRALALLRESLQAEKLAIEGNTLSFERRIKVKYGEEDVFGNLPEVKPMVRASIALPTLRVIKVSKRIPVLRSASIQISGDIEQEVLQAEQYSDKELQAIEHYFAEEQGSNSLVVKVEADAPVDQVGFELQELGSRYRQLQP